MSDALTLTAQIVSAHVAANRVQADQVPELIQSVFKALSGTDTPVEKPKEPAVPVRKSVFEDHLVCLECGGNFKVLKRHLETDHKLTVEDYRQRFSLPRDYPMVAPTYAEKRSALAKEIGLGRRRQGSPPVRRKRA